MAFIPRAFKNRDCDVPDCVYRLKYERNGQKLVAGIACVVENDRKKYLLTCNKVTLKNQERCFYARQWRKPLFPPRRNRDLDIKGENCFSKQNFSFLTPSNRWKPDKSLKVKSFDTGNSPDVIKSLIIEYPHKQREIEWVKNSETGGYKIKENEVLEDPTSLGSPVLWKDPKTQRFCVIGVVDKEEEVFLPRLFRTDDLRNFVRAGSPEITEHPQDDTKKEGEDVTLSCNARGNPEPQISWEKDGSTLTGNDRISLSRDKKKLTIKNLTKDDYGVYKGVASNIVSIVKSSCATLDVQCSPVITEHPQDDTKKEGEDVTLSCNARGNPEPQISWEKDGSTLTGNDRISLSHDKKKLTINNLTRDDCGKYQGVASNIVSSVNSNCALLDVQCSPEITEHPQSVTKREGEDVTLSCNARGNPEPQISWEKDGSTLTGNDRISLSHDKKKLTIKNLTKDDCGEYQGVASNIVSSVNSNCAILDVQYDYKKVSKILAVLLIPAGLFLLLFAELWLPMITDTSLKI